MAQLPPGNYSPGTPVEDDRQLSRWGTQAEGAPDSNGFDGARVLLWF